MEYKRELKALLQDPSLQLSYGQIWQMMDDELAKPTEEVDGELVRECIEALSEMRKRSAAEQMPAVQAEDGEPAGGAAAAENTKPEGKEVPPVRELPAAADDGRRARHRWRRKVAVLLAAILVVSVTVCMIPAKLFQSNADGSLVEYLADCVRVNLNGGKELKPVVVEELRNELAEHGFEDVLLPESYLPQYKMEEPEYGSNSISSWVTLYLEKGRDNLVIRIYNWISVQHIQPRDFDGQAGRIEQINYDDFIAIALDMEDHRVINYNLGLREYTITTSINMEETIELARNLS